MIPPYAMAAMRAFGVLLAFAMLADAASMILRSRADLALFLVCAGLAATVHAATLVGFARMQRAAQADPATRARRGLFRWGRR